MSKADEGEELRPRRRPSQDLKEEAKQNCYPAHQSTPHLDALRRRGRRRGVPRRAQLRLSQLSHHSSERRKGDTGREGAPDSRLSSAERVPSSAEEVVEESDGGGGRTNEGTASAHVPCTARAVAERC